MEWLGDRIVVAGGAGGGVMLYDTAGGPLRALGSWSVPGSLTALAPSGEVSDAVPATVFGGAVLVGIGA